MKILMIDDEIKILTLFKDFMETFGHKVEIAIDGDTGLKKFKNTNFDLIVMDYRMHGKNGLQVSREMMNIDKNVKILFVSADSSVEKKAIEMGAVGFLLKPFYIDVLIREIERVGKA